MVGTLANVCVASEPNGVEHHNVMKPLSWDNKQLGLASPLQSAASQSGQPITLARMRGLDVSHHTRISPRGGENSFFLTSPFIG